MGLKQYQRKRDFKQTPEPRGRLAKGARQRFVVQEQLSGGSFLERDGNGQAPRPTG